MPLAMPSPSGRLEEEAGITVTARILPWGTLPGYCKRVCLFTYGPSGVLLICSRYHLRRDYYPHLMDEERGSEN